MSSDSEATTEALSDQQRIERLEKAGKLNRLVIFVLAGILALVLLAWLTVGLLSLFDDSDTSASLARVEALQQKVGALEQRISDVQLQVTDQAKLITAKIASPHEQSAATDPVAPVIPSNANREVMQQVAQMLLGQERSYQETLAGMKIGMRDLAGMIAGSRSWLDYYTESVDKQLAASRTRAAVMQQWSATPKMPAAARQ